MKKCIWQEMLNQVSRKPVSQKRNVMMSRQNPHFGKTQFRCDESHAEKSVAMGKMENTYTFGRKKLTVALNYNYGLSWGAGVGFLCLWTETSYSLRLCMSCNRC